MIGRFERQLLTFFSCIVVWCSHGEAQDRPLKKINWGVTTLSASMWIPWIAKEARIYEKNGLSVEPILLRGSGQTSQALLGGSLFAAPVALPQVMLANLSGADMVNVAHTIASPSNKLVVKPEIRKPEDLRGRGSARQEGCYFRHRFTGRFSLSLHSAQARPRPQSRNSLAFHRHQCRAAASAIDRRHRWGRRDVPRGCASSAERLPAANRRGERSCLSDDVHRHAAKDNPGRPRYGNALCSLPCGRHCVFQTE